MYLNPDNVPLQRDLNSTIYVDKSMLIAELNRLIDTDENFLCVSRPRRFGKTMAGNMISAYYSKGCDSSELFKDLKIAKDKSYETYLNKLNVIKFDLNGKYMSLKDKSRLIESITEMVKGEMKEQFPKIRFTKGDSLADAIMKIYGTIERVVSRNEGLKLLRSDSTGQQMLSVFQETVGNTIPSYVNSQALGLALNDQVEQFILKETFGVEVPITSIKGMMGHSFGGRISIVYASRNEVEKLVLFGSPCVREERKSTKEKLLKSIKKLPGMNKIGEVEII